MNRSIYCWILRLHPYAFRRRFEQEMISTFDDAVQDRGGPSLIFDALLSLFRQRFLRPRRRKAAASLQVVPDGVPTFLSIGARQPHPIVLLFGATLSLIMFAGVVTTF